MRSLYHWVLPLVLLTALVGCGKSDPPAVGRYELRTVHDECWAIDTATGDVWFLGMTSTKPISVYSVYVARLRPGAAVGEASTMPVTTQPALSLESLLR